MFNQLKEWDKRLFLYLNGKHNSFFDVVMYWASDKLFWLPFYAVLLLLVVRYFKKKSGVVLLYIAALIAVSDQLASDLIKNTVKRLRPSHEIALQNFIHLSKAGAGGPYGFISSHACNSFALFAFLSLIFPRSFMPLKWVLFFWAIVSKLQPHLQWCSLSRRCNCRSHCGQYVGLAVQSSLLLYNQQMVAQTTVGSG